MAAIPVEQSELETWREAHKNLMDAVIVAREAVDAAKAQRRYWMEEICANLSPEGRLTQNSLWRQRVTPKKAAPKKKASKPPTTSKRKKSDDTLTDEEAPATNKKSKQPPPPTDNTAKADNHNSDSEEGGTTPIHNQWGNTHQGNPMMSNPYMGAVAMPAAQPMGGAFDMMSHIPAELRPFLAQAGGLPSVSSPPTPTTPTFQDPYTAVAQADDSDASE